MKIVIGLLLALFISGNAYAQSSAEILSKGRIISSHLTDDVNYKHILLVIFKDSLYECVVRTGTRNDKNFECFSLREI